MANGSDKYGPARADRLRDKSHALATKTKRAIRDLEQLEDWTDEHDRETRPSIVVQVQPPPFHHRVIESLRPRKKDESIHPRSTAPVSKHSLGRITAIVAAVVAGIVGALKAANIIP